MGFQFVLMFIDSFMCDVTYVTDVDVCVERIICYIPECVCYGCKSFGLEYLHDDCWTCWRNPTALFCSSISV
jgi:hypothetical protein